LDAIRKKLGDGCSEKLIERSPATTHRLPLTAFPMSPGIRAWAASVVDVHRVWIIGSRVTGLRRPKDDASPTPDLDVAYSLRGSDPGSLLAAAIIDGGSWKAQLQRALPGVSLDLQYADPDDEIVWPAARSYGVLIYEAED
jgi:hypothetical protein